MRALTTGDRTFLFRGEDMHTQYGMVRKGDIEKAAPGDVLATNTGKQMTVIETSFMDLYRKMKRGPQMIPQKDIGTIITETGIGKDSIVIDAGSGSGGLSIFLANICKKVYSYEIRDDFFDLVKKNIDFLGIKNITQIKGSIYDGIKQKNADVLTLDLPEPWKVIGHAANALKSGGYIVSYSPTIPQVSDFVEAINEEKAFTYLKTVEIILREWDVDKRKIRPKSQPIGHSGFMSFARKI